MCALSFFAAAIAFLIVGSVLAKRSDSLTDPAPAIAALACSAAFLGCFSLGLKFLTT
jgi:multidrug transporter EmrE-like cation transporter